MIPDSGSPDPARENDEQALIDAAWRQFAEIPASRSGGPLLRAAPGDRRNPDGGDARRSASREPGTGADHGRAAQASFATVGGSNTLTLPGAISGYRILSEIHRGGQGVVYQAIQESTRRKVAIKVLKEGPLAEAVELARFEREVDVLSRLKHPNIVTIHDRGQAGGFSYLVMDYIPGDALDDYLVDHMLELSLEDRLRLFVKICDAVNAAHLRGVIHRDLKPGNIRIDEEGEPRVLDFGLAKLDARGSAAFGGAASRGGADLTESGQFVGSLPWSSPEQASGRADQIDLRTDVYALGVILFQMLTGDFPYNVRGSLGEVLQTIIHTDPVRPRSLHRALDDEIETIVLKCLAKEQDRRYQSAGELARDIRRYLAHEPIEAKRDSGWYVLRKSLRRHRTATVFSVALVAAIMISAAVMFVLYRQAERAREQAAAEQRKAEAHAQRATSIQEFLEDMLSGLDPNLARDADTTLLRGLVDDAARRLEVELEDQPEAKASLHRTIGEIYKKIGRYEDAEKHFNAALRLSERLNPPGSRPIADAQTELADAIRVRGDLEAAEATARRALAVYRASPDDSKPFAMCLHVLGMVREARGDYEGALAFQRESLEMHQRLFGEGDETVALNLRDIGTIFDELNKPEEAERYIRNALATLRKLFGDDHLRVAETLNDLSSVLGKSGRFDEAAACLNQALDVQLRLLGPENSEAATTLNSLGTLLATQGEHKKAEAAYRESLRMCRARLDDDHAMTALVMGDLAMAIQRQGRLAEARPLMEEALERSRKRLGESSTEVATCMSKLGCLLQDLGELDKAESLQRRALRVRREAFGAEHPAVAESLNNLASVLAAAQRNDDAIAAYQECLGILRRAEGENTLEIATTLNNIAQIYRNTGRAAEAVPLYREALELLRPHAEAREIVGGLLSNLAGAVLLTDQPGQAEPLLREALGLFGPDSDPRRRILTMGLLGDALARLERPAEAEKTLLDAIKAAGRLPDAAASPAEPIVRRLIELYDALGRTADAEIWRSRLAKPPASAPSSVDAAGQ